MNGNALVPEGRRDKVDRLLMRSVIGLKHRKGLGIDWSNQPVRRRFDKGTVFAQQIDDIWTADLVDISSFSRSNKGYIYLLTLIDVFGKNGWIVPLKTKTDKEIAQALFLSGPPRRLRAG